MDKTIDKKNIWWELLRFAITGLTAAIFDYLICQLIILAFGNVSIAKEWITIISTAGGFIIGVTINYLMSTFWVYQNVDKNTKTKSPLFILIFILLSFVGLLLSIGAMLICDVVVKATLDYSIVSTSIVSLIKDYGGMFIAQPVFWAYIISFIIKTLVGLVFNYFTRKYILYKAPKDQNIAK